MVRCLLVRIHGNASSGGGRSNEGGNCKNGAATFTVHQLLHQVIRDDLGERPSEAMKVSVRVCSEGINGDWDQGWGERSRTNE